MEYSDAAVEFPVKKKKCGEKEGKTDSDVRRVEEGNYVPFIHRMREPTLM